MLSQSNYNFLRPGILYNGSWLCVSFQLRIARVVFSVRFFHNFQRRFRLLWSALAELHILALAVPVYFQMSNRALADITVTFTQPITPGIYRAELPLVDSPAAHNFKEPHIEHIFNIFRRDPMLHRKHDRALREKDRKNYHARRPHALPLPRMLLRGLLPVNRKNRHYLLTFPFPFAPDSNLKSPAILILTVSRTVARFN